MVPGRLTKYFSKFNRVLLPKINEEGTIVSNVVFLIVIQMYPKYNYATIIVKAKDEAVL